MDLSVRGGSLLSGGGGGTHLYGVATLPTVAHRKQGGGSGISAGGSRFLFTAVSNHGLLISAVHFCFWLLERPQSSIGSGYWRSPNHPHRCMVVSTGCWEATCSSVTCTSPIKLAETGYRGDLSYPCVFVNAKFTLYILGSLMPTASIASVNICLFFFMFAFLVPVY
jgi:hypothetical protein